MKHTTQSIKTWVLATRPKTLAIGLSPVLVGNCLGWKGAEKSVWIVVLTTLLAILLQVGANLANDYYDCRQGADSKERVGFQRACASGAIALKTMHHAFCGVFFVSCILALPLLVLGGWPSASCFCSMLLCGVFYTKGKKSLGYLGLGEIVVLLLFGPLSIMTIYHLYGLVYTRTLFLLTLPTGLLAAAVILVNNLRDIETDRQAGKRTLCVRLGAPFGKRLYIALLSCAFLIPLYLGLWLAVIPYALSFPLIRKITRYQDPSDLNALLVKTAHLVLITALVLCVGS